MVDKYAHLAPEQKTGDFLQTMKRQKMCLGKRPYSSKEDATRQMRGEVKKTYRCPICKLWHLTKGKKKK